MNISSDSQSSSEEEDGPPQRPGTAKRALKAFVPPFSRTPPTHENRFFSPSLFFHPWSIKWCTLAAGMGLSVVTQISYGQTYLTSAGAKKAGRGQLLGQRQFHGEVKERPTKRCRMTTQLSVKPPRSFAASSCRPFPSDSLWKAVMQDRSIWHAIPPSRADCHRKRRAGAAAL
jgi:hypothetical protein